jgi:hypothetical protein
VTVGPLLSALIADSRAEGYGFSNLMPRGADCPYNGGKSDRNSGAMRTAKPFEQILKETIQNGA